MNAMGNILDRLFGHRLDELKPSEREKVFRVLTQDKVIVYNDGYWNENYHKYENAGNYIVTRDVAVFNDARDRMCCGIYERHVRGLSGEIIYIGFDYGH